MKFSFIAIFFFWSVGITAQPLPQPAAAVFVNVIQCRKLRLTNFHTELIGQVQTEVEAGLMESRCGGALILRIGDEELDKVRDMEGLSDEQIQQLRYGFFVEIREQPKHEPYSLNIKMVELSTKALVKQVSFNILVGVMEAARERQDVIINNILNAGFCEQKLSPPIEPSPPSQEIDYDDTDQMYQLTDAINGINDMMDSIRNVGALPTIEQFDLIIKKIKNAIDIAESIAEQNPEINEIISQNLIDLKNLSTTVELLKQKCNCSKN